jgi:hypothetical protein
MPNIIHLVVKKNGTHIYFEYPALKSWSPAAWPAAIVFFTLLGAPAVRVEVISGGGCLRDHPGAAP